MVPCRRQRKVHVGVGKPNIPLFPGDALRNIAFHTIVIVCKHESGVQIDHFIEVMSLTEAVNEIERIASSITGGLCKTWWVTDGTLTEMSQIHIVA